MSATWSQRQARYQAADKATVQFGLALIWLLKGLRRDGRTLVQAVVGRMWEPDRQGPNADDRSCGTRIRLVYRLVTRGIAFGKALQERLTSAPVAMALEARAQEANRLGRPARKLHLAETSDDRDPLPLPSLEQDGTMLEARVRIATLTDEEVLLCICSDLLRAAVLLGCHEKVTRIAALARQATALITGLPDEDVPGAPRPAAYAMWDGLGAWTGSPATCPAALCAPRCGPPPG